MITVAVIEDEQAQAEIIKNRILGWSRIRGIGCTSVCFDSSESFLFAYEDKKKFDILFIDIQLNGISGINLARKLRQRGDTSVMIFITAIRDYVFEGYDVDALHYLVKPFEVYSKFDTLVGNKTAVFISHRLSSCRFCHDIMVFHEGRIVERGSHEELLQDKTGRYHALWNAQAQYYSE